MEKLIAMHIPGNGDVCPTSKGMYVRFRAEKGKVISASLIYQDNKFEWWVSQKSAEMQKTLSDSTWDYFELDVRCRDQRFAYIFKLTTAEGNTLYLHEEGLTESYDNAYSFLNYFQYTSQFPGEYNTVPDWVGKACCYQIFVERFNIGDKTKDMSYTTNKWGELPKPKSFFGGDLEGIRKKLSYLKNLGVNMIYITPVFKSVSNHKYDIKDYENVDEMFGGNEALRDFIADAHEKGMKVMIDGVFNHTAWEHPYFLDVCEKGKDSRYADWYYFDKSEKPSFEKRNYRTFASVAEMPKLNTGNKEVIDYFSHIGEKWIREYGADAWRLDVSDEVSHHFLRSFRDRVLEAKSDAIIIGEDWHNASGYLDGDQYDGTMNYGLMKACIDLFALERIDSSVFKDRLIDLYMKHSPVTNRKMLNLLDSHDTDRFLQRCGGNHDKYRAALAVQFFYPGLPCVYYGDEIGLMGGYDPDCRRCFDWNRKNWEMDTWNLCRKLMKMKKGKALAYGDFDITEHGGIVEIVRRFKDKEARLILNATSREVEALPAWHFRIEEK